MRDVLGSRKTSETVMMETPASRAMSLRVDFPRTFHILGFNVKLLIENGKRNVKKKIKDDYRGQPRRARIIALIRYYLDMTKALIESRKLLR